MAERKRLLIGLCVLLALSACRGAPLLAATQTRPPTAIVTLLPRTPTPDRGSADHDLGNADAFLHIIHYGDLQCAPYLS
jgi:hypothetical protein